MQNIPSVTDLLYQNPHHCSQAICKYGVMEQGLLKFFVWFVVWYERLISLGMWSRTVWWKFAGFRVINCQYLQVELLNRITLLAIHLLLRVLKLII